MDCLFCKIVSGDIPSSRVYEDDLVVAFLDIAPVNKGHALIVPKKHEENFLVASSKTVAWVMQVAQKVAAAVLEATGAQGFNIHVNNGRVSGQEIDHLHVHVIPRFASDGLKHWPKVAYGEGEMAKVSENIAAQLR